MQENAVLRNSSFVESTFVWIRALLYNLQLTAFNEIEGFPKCFQHFLAFWLFKQVHRKALKPPFHFPPPLLSPVFSKIGREFHGRNAAAGMRLFLIVANAFLNLLGVLNLNVNEATSLTMT